MQKSFADALKEKIMMKEELLSVASNDSTNSNEQYVVKKATWSPPLIISFDAHAIVDHIFRMREFKKETIAMDVYRNLYLADKTRLQITANIHQNSLTDVPHISARLWITDKWSHNLHFNGYISGESFFCVSVTALVRGHDVETVLEFE